MRKPNTLKANLVLCLVIPATLVEGFGEDWKVTPVARDFFAPSHVFFASSFHASSGEAAAGFAKSVLLYVDDYDKA